MVNEKLYNSINYDVIVATVLASKFTSCQLDYLIYRNCPNYNLLSISVEHIFDYNGQLSKSYYSPVPSPQKADIKVANIRQMTCKHAKCQRVFFVLDYSII